MAGQFSEFLAHIKRYGVAKTSHFRLSIPLSFVDKTGNKQFADLNKLMGLRCEATELPGRQLLSNDSRTYGPTYKTPYQSLYQEITLNFLETDKFLIRNFFELWMSNIFNPQDNVLNYPRRYRYPVTLKQYDTIPDGKADQPNQNVNLDLVGIAAWELQEAFPTAINQMPVAWSEDGLHRTTVTLAYEWYILTTGAQAKNLAKDSGIVGPVVPPRGSAVT